MEHPLLGRLYGITHARPDHFRRNGNSRGLEKLLVAQRRPDWPFLLDDSLHVPRNEMGQNPPRQRERLRGIESQAGRQ